MNRIFIPTRDYRNVDITTENAINEFDTFINLNNVIFFVFYFYILLFKRTGIIIKWKT